MVRFNAEIKKFGVQGEKTGWTYIEIDAKLAGQLQPGSRQSFRVKGKLDSLSIQGVALLPMGEGNFIMPLNADMRRKIKKGKGSILQVQLQIDKEEIQPPAVLMECLAEEPEALAHFNSLPKSQKNYFIKWISSAKSEPTITNRVAQTMRAMATGLGFTAMMREMKKFREDGMR